MTATFSRQSFPARSALLVGALAGIKAFAPGEAVVVAAPPAAEWPKTAFLREWWVQSNTSRPLKVTARLGFMHSVTHYVSPHMGFYMVYPLGRRVQIDRFLVDDVPVTFNKVNFTRSEDGAVYVSGSSVDCLIGAVWEE